MKKVITELFLESLPDAEVLAMYDMQMEPEQQEISFERAVSASSRGINK
ncbi:hypothetical protein [Nostoc sp. ChiQUE01b]|nr:hypothetical protein [Nostoc sp. ChiQUE01b]